MKMRKENFCIYSETSNQMKLGRGSPVKRGKIDYENEKRKLLYLNSKTSDQKKKWAEVPL